MNTSLDERRLEDLIEQANERERAREVANEEAQAWRASEARYNQKREAEHRREWASYHLSQAARLEQAAVELAASHRAQAEKLLGEEDA